MSATYVTLQARLALYLAAEEKILKGQEYQVGQGSNARRLRRADLAEVRSEIASLNAQIAIHPENPARAAVRRVRYFRAY